VSEATQCAEAERVVAVQLRDHPVRWVGWLPLLLFPMAVVALRAKLLAWLFMWLLATAIFVGCKWLTWWEARSSGLVTGNWKRSLAYLLLWPGMEAKEFFVAAAAKRLIQPSEWIAGAAKSLTGVALIWAGARAIPHRHALLGGWMGMVGLLLFLHFGTFHLAALAWQKTGIPVKPIMQRPLTSRSLSELWGRRWNLGFRSLSHAWVFHPLQTRFGPTVGTLGAFLASGLLHDAVISLPARAGYGLPAVYFLVQGLGVAAERSVAGQRFGLGRGVRGRLWAAVIALGPLYALFHPWFVTRVIDPFLRVIAG
jgi:hypothetical protein